MDEKNPFPQFQGQTMSRDRRPTLVLTSRKPAPYVPPHILPMNNRVARTPRSKYVASLSAKENS